MKELINYLLQFGSLNQQQINLVVKKAEEKTLRKEAYFSEAGNIAQQVGFLLEGILRVCYNNQGDEITRYFLDENNFVVDLNSFTSRIPSTEYVQAITDCRLILFSYSNWRDLSNTIVAWDKILSKITAKALLQKTERISPLVAENATIRYLEFHQKYPNLSNRIPLSYLASYLGITPSSLSRIRKNIC